ncbi:MAG: hypothetical protein ACM3L6_07200 [Deltaproteobacteria bacterium]
MAKRTVHFIAAGLLAVGIAWACVPEGRPQDDSDKYLYKGQGTRDPFLPLITPSGQLINLEPETDTALRLEGIMFDPNGNSIAIINGELLRVGESLGDAVVVAIEEDKVTLVRQNETLELQLRREE